MHLPRLREWRESEGLTQEELGGLAGIAGRTVHRLEVGEGTRPQTARKLATALGVSVADLLAEPPALLERRPVPLGDAPTSGLVRAAESHASMGSRLAEILGPELKEREGDLRWLTRVELMLRDYGVVLQEVLGHVTLPDRDTAELVAAKGMDLNSFYARVEEALARAKERARTHA